MFLYGLIFLSTNVYLRSILVILAIMIKQTFTVCVLDLLYSLF
jgi:hypothetical protein